MPWSSSRGGCSLRGPAWTCPTAIGRAYGGRGLARQVPRGLAHVGRDDGGDDAAECGANNLAVRRTHANAGVGLAAATDRGFRRGIRAPVGRLQSRCHPRAHGTQHAALVSSAMRTTTSVLAGLLLVAAGVYQWTPLKRACLRNCRSPIHFVTRHWRAGLGGAFRLGLFHGAYCVGCCWALMGLLFVAGVMNVAWVAALAVFVLLEENDLPRHARGPSRERRRPRRRGRDRARTPMKCAGCREQQRLPMASNFALHRSAGSRCSLAAGERRRSAANRTEEG